MVVNLYVYVAVKHVCYVKLYKTVRHYIILYFTVSYNKFLEKMLVFLETHETFFIDWAQSIFTCYCLRINRAKLLHVCVQSGAHIFDAGLLGRFSSLITAHQSITLHSPGPLVSEKVPFFECRNPHYKPRPDRSRVYNRNPYTNKTKSSSLVEAQLIFHHKSRRIWL